MCHGAESAPPFAISATRGARGTPTEITSEDGTRFAAYVADRGDPGGAGAVVLPDDRGLAPFYAQWAATTRSRAWPRPSPRPDSTRCCSTGR
jgi:carboxymethylenebutenolidase